MARQQPPAHHTNMFQRTGRPHVPFHVHVRLSSASASDLSRMQPCRLDPHHQLHVHRQCWSQHSKHPRSPCPVRCACMQMVTGSEPDTWLASSVLCVVSNHLGVQDALVRLIQLLNMPIAVLRVAICLDVRLDLLLACTSSSEGSA